MKDTRVNYVVVGAFTLAMLVAIVVVVALLTGRTGATDTYYTRFDNVSGVKFGTKVLFEGYPVGQVEDIVPEREAGETVFTVVMSVEEGWPIPEGSVARVAASGLLAAVAINIEGGRSAELIAPGAVVPSAPGGNLFAAVNDVAAEVGDLSRNSLKPLLATLNTHIDRLGVILERQAPQLFANLLAVSADLADKTPHITEDVARFTERVLSPENARSIETTIASMETTAANFAELSMGLRETRGQIRSVMTSLDQMVSGNREKVDQSVADLSYTLRTISRNIDSVTYNLEATSRNMQEFSRQIRDNPGILLGGTKGGEQGPGRR